MSKYSFTSLIPMSAVPDTHGWHLELGIFQTGRIPIFPVHHITYWFH